MKVSLGLSTQKSFIVTKWFSLTTSVACHTIFSSNIFTWVAEISESLPELRRVFYFFWKQAEPSNIRGRRPRARIFSRMMRIKEMNWPKQTKKKQTKKNLSILWKHGIDKFFFFFFASRKDCWFHKPFNKNLNKKCNYRVQPNLSLVACRAFKKVHVTWNAAKTNSTPPYQSDFVAGLLFNLYSLQIGKFFLLLSFKCIAGCPVESCLTSLPPHTGSLVCAVLPSDKPRTHSVYSSAIFSHSSRAMQITLHSTCDSWLTAAGTIFLSSIPSCADSFPGLGPPPTLHTFICQGTNEGVSFTTVSSPRQHWIMHVSVRHFLFFFF